MTTISTAALVLLAACGSDDPKSTPVGSNVATGSAIKIGALAPSDGAGAFPEVEYGIQAAEWYINNELGGINGHQLEVDICRGNGSPETAVSCANKFVSEGYPVVLDGGDVSSGGARPGLMEAGILLTGSSAGDPANEPVKVTDGAYYTGPFAVTVANIGTIWRNSDTEKANFAVSDSPAAHRYVDSILSPFADTLDVDLSVQYVDENKANWNAIAAALVDGSPDISGSISMSEDGCTALVSALRQQGHDGDIFMGSCSKYVEELASDETTGVMTFARTWVYPAKEHAPDDVAQQLEDFATAMDAVGHGDALEARATYAFAGLVTLAQVLQTIDGDITSEAVTTAMTAVKDQQMFLGPKMTCDGKQWPGIESSCTRQSIYYTVQEDGSYKPGDPAGFVDVPADMLEALS